MSEDWLVDAYSQLDNLEYPQDSHDNQNYYLQVILAFLVYPFHVLYYNYGTIIKIVLVTRVAHLIADLFRTPQLIKNLITCILGYHQIINYLTLSSTELSDTRQNFLATVIITYIVFLHLVAKLCKRTHNAHLLNYITPAMMLFPIFINEYNIHIMKHQQHTNLRAILMILSMKMVSKLDKVHLSNDVTGTLAYLLHPSSCLMGPWHEDFEEEGSKSIRHLLNKFRQQLIVAVKEFAKTYLLLMISDELISSISALVETSDVSTLLTKTFTVYSTAQEFRFSHYFVIYMTSSFLNLWTNPESKYHRLCDIAKVEYPRSLVEVVIYWNVNMHNWLKNYVFDRIKCQTQNVPVAIFCTYMISSTLHGFKFNIWAVLFSLGFLSWIEHEIRYKLSARFSACILARQCKRNTKKTCIRGHRRDESNSISVRAFNLMFRILAIVHLAYLGSIFIEDFDARSYTDDLRSWSSLYFYSPILGMLTYATCLLL